MVKNFRKKKFTTYSALEKYFTKKILPQKNKSSKVIGKTLFVWDKKPKNEYCFTQCRVGCNKQTKHKFINTEDKTQITLACCECVIKKEAA